jgi:hypothetical protein
VGAPVEKRPERVLLEASRVGKRQILPDHLDGPASHAGLAQQLNPCLFLRVLSSSSRRREHAAAR